MDEMSRDIERMIFGVMSKEAGLPETAQKFVDCMVKNGCPLKSVLNGIVEFGEIMQEKEDRDNLKELLKDLPIKLEDE